MKNATTTAQTATANLDFSAIMEFYITGIEAKGDTLTFTEISNFGLTRTTRTIPTAWRALYELFNNARGINQTTPAALANLLLEGRPLTDGLFRTASQLKAPRTNGFSEFQALYTPEQLDKLAAIAQADLEEARALTLFDCKPAPAGAKPGDTLTFFDAIKGRQTALLILAEPSGSTILLNETGIFGLFQEAQIGQMDAEMHTMLLEGAKRFAEKMAGRKEQLQRSIERKQALETARNAKAIEAAEKFAAKLISFAVKNGLPEPTTFDAETFEAMKTTAKAANEAKKAAAAAAKEAAAKAKADAKAAADAKRAEKAEQLAAKQAAEPKADKPAKKGKKAENSAYTMATTLAAALNELTA